MKLLKVNAFVILLVILASLQTLFSWQNVTSIIYDLARPLATVQTYTQTITVNGNVLPAPSVTCKISILPNTTECEAVIPNLNPTGNNIVISVFDKVTNTTAETRINNFSAATFPPNPTGPKLKLVQNISFP